MRKSEDVFVLVVYDGMGNQTIKMTFRYAAKAAAEWMLRVSQGQDARLSVAKSEVIPAGQS